MRILKQHFWCNIISGLLWLGVGISGMFAAGALQISFFAAIVVILVLVALSNPEEDDEMSQQNYILAKAHTLDIMPVVFCLCAILSAVAIHFWPHTVSLLPEIFFLLIGAKNICAGVIFRKLEGE